MNPYLTEDNQATETLEYTLDYYGISLDEFKAMTDEQVVGMGKRFSDVLNDGRIIKSQGGCSWILYTFLPRSPTW